MRVLALSRKASRVIELSAKACGASPDMVFFSGSFVPAMARAVP